VPSPLILGVDFTSRPCKGKPITAAIGRLMRDGVLGIEDVRAIESFPAYESFLETLPRPWISCFDHPFGQPVALLDLLGLPRQWAAYVDIVGAWGRDRFTDHIKTLQSQQATGAPREWHRLCDALAGASAPHKYVNPPVGWMFVEGTPRLLRTGVSVRPLHESDPARIALEAYPKLVARRMADRYKNDAKAKQSPVQAAGRRAILAGLGSARLKAEFGFIVRLPAALARTAETDASGDTLDAVLCAAQAGWAWSMRGSRRAPYGIPNGRHPTITAEGWIVDPSLIGPRFVPR
jgi:hypothetical protein